MAPEQFGDRTDIISNDVLIAACRAPGGVQALLNGRLPLTAYSAFAHEVTHHWCFLSPVGAVTALLRASSDSALWRARTVGEVKSAAPRRAVADTLTAVMRPTAEGLALFAQLNMRMSNSGVTADPSLWVTNHFVDAQDVTSEFDRLGISIADAKACPDAIPSDLYKKFEARVNAFLDQARLGNDQLVARERLSMRPLDTQDGGYLSGYLLLRRCHNRIRHAGVEPIDANSFMSFAREFFFHDTILAAIALRDGAGMDEIASRMRHRLELFDSDEIVKLYRRFIEADLATPRSTTVTRWKPTIYAGIGTAADGDEIVEAAMAEILQEVGALPHDGEEINLAAGIVLFRVANRDVFKLGSISGPLSTKMIGPIRSVMFEPDPSYDMYDKKLIFTQSSGPDFDSAVGEVDLLYWSAADRLAVACYVNSNLIALSAKYEGLSPAAITVFKANVDERRRLEHNITLINEQASVALNYVFKDFEGHINRYTNELIDQLLADRIFPGKDSARQIFEDLRDRGFFKLYDSADRVSRYARLCALAASESWAPGAEIEDDLNWSSRCEFITGWPMLEIVRGQLLTAL